MSGNEKTSDVQILQSSQRGDDDLACQIALSLKGYTSGQARAILMLAEARLLLRESTSARVDVERLQGVMDRWVERSQGVMDRWREYGTTPSAEQS
jgi:hypothetical protein